VKVPRLDPAVAADEAFFLLGAHLLLVLRWAAGPRFQSMFALGFPRAVPRRGLFGGLVGDPGAARLRGARFPEVSVAVGDGRAKPGAVVTDWRRFRIVSPPPPKLEVRPDAPHGVALQTLPGSVRPDSRRKEPLVKLALVFGTSGLLGAPDGGTVFFSASGRLVVDPPEEFLRDSGMARGPGPEACGASPAAPAPVGFLPDACVRSLKETSSQVMEEDPTEGIPVERGPVGRNVTQEKEKWASGRPESAERTARGGQTARGCRRTAPARQVSCQTG